MDKQNCVFLFMPFHYRESFAALNDRLAGENSHWLRQEEKPRYLFKYISDKIGDAGVCSHFSLSDGAKETYGLGETPQYSISGFQEKQRKRFFFALQDAQLFCFNTGVGILVYQIRFEDGNPRAISSALFDLKRVNTRHFIGPSGKNTLQSLAERLMSAGGIQEPDWFFHVSGQEERANAFLYVETEPNASSGEKPDDPRTDLFYLRNCYNDSYRYWESPEQEAAELYQASDDCWWGVSLEAAACRVRLNEENRHFRQEVFFKNICRHYLLVYVLLLHQKYVLYLFLTEINVKTYSDLDTLENYKNRLYEFETDFVYSNISEVPQYQKLYERIRKVFALREMYEDVHEPIRSLGEVRRSQADKEQHKRESRVNGALAALSALVLFSALVDSYDFIEKVCGKLGCTAVNEIQGSVITLILCVFIGAMYCFFSKGKRRK